MTKHNFQNCWGCGDTYTNDQLFRLDSKSKAFCEICEAIMRDSDDIDVDMVNYKDLKLNSLQDIQKVMKRTKGIENLELILGGGLGKIVKKFIDTAIEYHRNTENRIKKAEYEAMTIQSLHMRKAIFGCQYDRDHFDNEFLDGIGEYERSLAKREGISID